MYAAWFLKTTISNELKPLGLTHEQYNVLRILKGAHPTAICNKDIAGRMIEKGSNVPRIIDRLEAKKLVKRFASDEDRRETLIAISEEGMKMLQIATAAVTRTVNKQLSLSEPQCAELNNLLSGFLKD